MPKHTFLISDESVNHHGFRILTDGIDLSYFLANPVLLYNHHRSNTDVTVYGRWEGMEKKDGKLSGDPVFDLSDKMGKKLASKVKGGFLHAVSLNVRILEASDAPEHKLPGQRGPTIVRSQLREVSMTDIPGNGNSVRLFDADDNEIDVVKLSDFTTNASFKSQTAPKMDELQYLGMTLGLSDDKPNLSAVNGAIRKLMDKAARVDVLEAQLKDYQKKEEASQADRAEALLTKAEEDGRITTAQRTSFATLFDKDFEGTAEVLKGLPKQKKLKDIPAGGKGGGDTTTLSEGKYNGKTFREWEIEDDGTLARLKSEDEETYNELYKEQYGSFPTKG